MTDYDDVAERYSSLSELEVRLQMEYTFNQRIGDVTGKRVLDLACGDGVYTRMNKEHGAARVVGVDISGEMLRIARQRELREQLGVEYIQADARTLGKIGDFDIVLGAYLFNAAETREDLLRMCQTAYVNLQPGGRFLAVNNNPRLSSDHFDDRYSKYRSHYEVRTALPEGGHIIRLYFGEGDEHEHIWLDFYHLGAEAIEWALQTAGFKNIQWFDAIPSPKGLHTHGEEYWRDFIAAPPLGVTECHK